MGNVAGSPGVQVSITDLSIILENSLKGIFCLQGITERGVPGKNYLVGSWTEFKKVLGAEHADDDFPLLCKAALDGGAKLRVTRSFHYTDITDISTAEGTKATLTATIAEVLSTGTVTITAGTNSAGVNDIDDITVNGVSVMSAAEDWVTSHTATATAVAANITAHTSSPDYNAAAVGPVVTISALATTGDGPNTFVVLAVIAAGDVETTDVNMAGGVTNQVGAFEAEATGDGYNTATIVIADSVSGTTGNIDISITLPDSGTTNVVSNVTSSPTAPQIVAINAEMLQHGVKLTSMTNNIPNGSFTLTSGVQVVANIVDADYKGDQSQQTGWYVFDTVTDSMRIANMNNANATADADLVAYIEQRADMRGYLRTPLGLNTTLLEAYIKGTTPYSHSRINSLYVEYFYTDAEITDPQNSKVKDKSISGIGHLVGKRSKMDNKFGEWFSESGNWGGQLNGINKVPINFISGGLKTQYDNLYELGLNALVKDNGIVFPWGNRNCKIDKTKLTHKSNIADLVVFIARVVSDIAKEFSFQPNDFIMFNKLYRKVRPFITTVLVDGRAIQGDKTPTKGEGTWWHWLGDQYAKTPADLTFNNSGDIDAGIYKVRFAFKPIAANEYIVIDIAPADSVTILNVQILNEI